MENLKNEQSDLAKTAEFLRQTEQFLGKLRDENYATLSLNDLLAWQMSGEQRHEFSIYLSARVQFRLFSQMQRCFRDMSAMLRNDEELKHCFQIVTHAMLMSGVYFYDRYGMLLDLYLEVWQRPPRFVPQKMSASLVYADVLCWLTANLWRYADKDKSFDFKLLHALRESTYYRRENSSCSEDARRIYRNLCKLCRNDNENRVFASVFAVLFGAFAVYLIEKTGGEFLNYVVFALLEIVLLTFIWRRE